MRTLLSMILAAGLALTAAPAVAAGGGGDGSSGGGGGTVWNNPGGKTDPDFAAGRDAVEAKDWAGAVAALKRAVETDPENADAFNLLGYSLRQSGDVDAALVAYERALTLDPKHKGAHEYIGEAYLQIGDVAKAEEHLAALDDICFFGCDEYTELKEKIAGHKAKATN